MVSLFIMQMRSFNGFLSTQNVSKLSNHSHLDVYQGVEDVEVFDEDYVGGCVEDFVLAYAEDFVEVGVVYDAPS
jgi:hypothetical protein